MILLSRIHLRNTFNKIRNFFSIQWNYQIKNSIRWKCLGIAMHKAFDLANYESEQSKNDNFSEELIVKMRDALIFEVVNL
jgi:hypothetical protein